MTKFFDTDDEAGAENLTGEAEKAQRLRALDVMRERGLISVDDYNQAVKVINE